MHQVIASYLNKFSDENALQDLDEAERFERFVNYCVVARRFPDQFDVGDVTTSVDDDGIDGCAVIIDSELITTAEAATELFVRRKTRSDLVVTYLFVQAKRTEGFESDAITALGTGVQRLFDKEGGSPNDEILQEMRRLHEVVVDNLSRIKDGRPECMLYYAATGSYRIESGLSKYSSQQERALTDLGLFSRVVFNFIDREELIKLWNLTREAVEAAVAVKSFIPIPKFAGVEEAYICLISAPEFVNQLLSEKDGRIRTAVFEQNVRAFLGEENTVNTRIRETITDPTQHDRFALLNNGVTIVSPDVRVQSERVSIRDYQIVNGCQTSHVLHRNRHLLTERIFVPVKIIEAEAPEIVASVVEATNSQSDVQESQFLSIKPFVRKIEQYFDSFDNPDDQEHRLYFERRTRQFAGSDIGRVRTFDIAKIARCFASMFLDVPHLAARYPTLTIEEEAGRLFQPEHRERAYYVAALAMYRLDLSLGNQYVPRKYQAYRWHLLWILRHQVAGPELPPLNAKKFDGHVDKIFAVLRVGGKQAATPFLEAAKVLDQVGLVGRDKLRGQRYTEEVKRTLVKRGAGKNARATKPAL